MTHVKIFINIYSIFVENVFLFIYYKRIYQLSVCIKDLLKNAPNFVPHKQLFWNDEMSMLQR